MKFSPELWVRKRGADGVAGGHWWEHVQGTNVITEPKITIDVVNVANKLDYIVAVVHELGRNIAVPIGSVITHATEIRLTRLAKMCLDQEGTHRNARLLGIIFPIYGHPIRSTTPKGLANQTNGTYWVRSWTRVCFHRVPTTCTFDALNALEMNLSIDIWERTRSYI
jgi:hypothetical protein